MSIVLYHHPFSRAANVVWVLEEAEVPYELRWVDFMKGEHKSPDMLKLNPMGKLPILTDGDVVATESAAIALYVADRYSYGRLAPKHDDPRRAAYLRWSFFAPSVIEPGLTAKGAGWTVKESQVGWGNHDAMISAMEQALEGKDYLLGETFSMADVVFGGTVRFMLTFGMLEKRPLFNAYVERLSARPGSKRAEAKNAEVMKAHDLKMPGG